MEGLININNIEKYINTINCMDNLEFMKQLSDNSIDLIYCDILYGTSRKFKDYDDKLGTPLEAMDWYKPRLIEMYRILKDTGNILLQMDNNLSHYMKVEMDKLFNLNNFQNEIIWKRSNGNSLSKSMTNITDKILWYSKTNKFTYNQQYQELKDNTYTLEKETGRYFKHCSLENKPNFKYKGEKRVINNLVYKTDIGWKWSQETINKRLKENPYIFYITKNNKVRYKVYQDETKGKGITNLWDDINLVTSTSNERIDYNTQKPKTLLERIIKMCSNENDIIADVFCGSGTTGVVAKKLNRKYILCDNNPKACKISKERINKITS